LQNLYSPKVVKEFLSRYNILLKKKFGQNFLVDKNTLEKIAHIAELDNSTSVLEIGPGIGTLTVELSKRAKNVLTIEIDISLKPVLDEILADSLNVKTIYGDFLNQDLNLISKTYFDDKPFTVVANVPYYITSQIIMSILESKLEVNKLVLLVQKEVAQRIVAKPGTKDFGAISNAVQYRMIPRIAAIVPRTVFMPMPDVDSAILVLDKRNEPAVTVEDSNLMFAVIKASFAQRRKKLINSLTILFPKDKPKDEVLEILNGSGVDLNRRGETLSLEEFAKIADTISKSSVIIAS